MSETFVPPRIVMCRDDFDTLGNLADAAGPEHTAAARLLQDELQRTRVAPSGKLPADVVRIGSRVRYRTGEGRERTVQLVLPYLADINEGRVSVLTPVGAALIGLSQGQAMAFTAAGGRRQVIQVMEVMKEAAP